MKKDDAIEDDDNSHLTFSNLLSREMGMEEEREKEERGWTDERKDAARVEEGQMYALNSCFLFLSPPYCAQLSTKSFCRFPDLFCADFF